MRPLEPSERTTPRSACRGPLQWPCGKSRTQQWAHTSRQQASRRVSHPRLGCPARACQGSTVARRACRQHYSMSVKISR